MIKVSINGEVKTIKDGLNINELLKELNYVEKGFALAINMTFIAINSYEKTQLKEGDKIDILAPVQGG